MNDVNRRRREVAEYQRVVWMWEHPIRAWVKYKDDGHIAIAVWLLLMFGLLAPVVISGIRQAWR